MSEYIIRKTVLIKHRDHDNIVGEVVPIADIQQWVQKTLEKWKFTAMHSTEYIGKQTFLKSNWQQTNLIVNGEPIVSIYVEEWEC